MVDLEALGGGEGREGKGRTWVILILCEPRCSDLAIEAKVYSLGGGLAKCLRWTFGVNSSEGFYCCLLSFSGSL